MFLYHAICAFGISIKRLLTYSVAYLFVIVCM